MSETDDTDDLLLIPPDFFTINAELEVPYLTGPYYSVVDSLIEQVNNLEHRINFIEYSSESFISNSLEYLPKSESMSGVRKYNSSDDIRKINKDGGYLESTQSTPQKPQTRFRLNAIDSSPNLSPQKRKTHINSIYSKQYKSPTKFESDDQHKEEILQEIDGFISNMQKFNNVEKHKPNNERLSLNDLKHILRQVESQEKDFEPTENNKEKIMRERTWQCGDDKASVPDYGYGVRNAMYSKANETGKNYRTLTVESMYDQGPSTSDLSTVYTDSYAERTESVSSSSESTQVTALPNVNRLLPSGRTNSINAISNSHRNENQNRREIHSTYNNNVAQEPRNDIRRVRRNIMDNNGAANKANGIDDNSHKLLSLSYLWKQRSKDFQAHEVNVTQKLEEEKLRRQHCEQLIQQLQLRTLELQERLAVALQVDEAKDDAILRFHKAWEQVAVRLQTLTRERDDLEKEINNINSTNSNNIGEAAKKIAHFENEASKALTLAHSNQEKLSVLEKRCTNLTNENEELLKKIAIVSSDCEIEGGKTKHLSEIIAQKETELNESKKVLSNAQTEISQSKRAVELCQAELTNMKTQYTHLELVLNEKQDIIKNLESHNRKLSLETDTHKKIEKDLQHELNKVKEANEKSKIDLRNFYQDQVEIVVRDKLKEFQSQLDRAETSLQDELKKRELTIAKSAAVHIQQITEKHALEVRLLEEKNNEEIRLYQVQLSQAKQHIENMHYKFQQQQQKKSEMAQQLHKVMEAQWLEALRIINNGRSPIISQDQDVTLNQLNILKSKSHSNLEEVLSMDLRGNAADIKLNKKEVEIPLLNLGPSTSSMNGDMRNSVFGHESETPISSRPRSKQQIEVELQKYVQMLLNKSPGNPMQESTTKEFLTNNDQHTWLPNVQDDKTRFTGSKDRKQKPPWK